MVEGVGVGVLLLRCCLLFAHVLWSGGDIMVGGNGGCRLCWQWFASFILLIIIVLGLLALFLLISVVFCAYLLLLLLLIGLAAGFWWSFVSPSSPLLIDAAVVVRIINIASISRFCLPSSLLICLLLLQSRSCRFFGVVAARTVVPAAPRGVWHVSCLHKKINVSFLSISSAEAGRQHLSALQYASHNVTGGACVEYTERKYIDHTIYLSSIYA